MSIPTTKASTTHVDEGSDKISLARPDIKQNIDNVNEIIDHLNAQASFLPCYITYGDDVTTTQEDTLAPAAESPSLITAGNTGISIVAGDSAGGQSRISIPAGTYLLETNRGETQGMTPGVGFVEHIAFKDTVSGKFFGVQKIRTTGHSGGTSLIPRGEFGPIVARQTFSSTAEIELLAQCSNATQKSYRFGYEIALGDSAGGPSENENVGFLVKITKLS